MKYVFLMLSEPMHAQCPVAAITLTRPESRNRS